MAQIIPCDLGEHDPPVEAVVMFSFLDGTGDTKGVCQDCLVTWCRGIAGVSDAMAETANTRPDPDAPAEGAQEGTGEPGEAGTPAEPAEGVSEPQEGEPAAVSGGVE